MADFTRPGDAPNLGKVFPHTCRDLGAVISRTALGAATVLSSTETGSLGRHHNPSSSGVQATMTIANKSGTIDVVMTIRRYNKATGTFTDFLSTTSQTANGTTILTVHPALTAAANSIAKDFIGEEFDIKVVSGTGSTPSLDLTVGVTLLP
jgi:hypothetical protein